MTITPSPPPRDEGGQLLCQQCMKNPVPPSLGTKPRIYCSRNCRQRAYESRRTRSIVSVAVEVALSREAKSRDERSATSRDNAGATSRDVAKPQVKPANPPVPPARAAAAPLWEDSDIEVRLARYGIGADGQELNGEG
ncbi:hypothetical protein AB0L80_41820 [Streptomyces sp. NPDC052069]|uniref:hypothetical protein n=1 Tax=Streptomyces sp. NPDC052069 TaxID=3154650 RepID=UPI0034301862